MIQSDFDKTARESNQRYLDLARESRYAYWNALLTLDGILISVFSAIGIISKSNRLMIAGIVLLSILSAWMLIQNFRMVKDLYLRLGQTTADDVASLSQEQKDAEINHQKEEHRLMNQREDNVERLLFVQAFFIVLFLVA